MVSGTLYTYPGNVRSYKIQIAAEYSGSTVTTDPGFEFGKTNTSESFLKKFPLGKVPAFEDGNGNCLTEGNAIMQYVSNEALRGGSDAYNQGLVQQFISFADNEVFPSACTWTFPTLGFKQYNKQETEKAQTQIKKCLELLNNHLSTKTFLVGERVTLADISLCCNLLMLYAQVLDPTFRGPFTHVNRWFITCINQPAFKKILGDVKLCEKMATFDSQKYQELHPKEQKKGKDKEKKEKQKQTTPKKEEPKKEVEKEATKEAVNEEEPPKPKKIDYFADVPKSNFILDEWKKMYSNNETDVSLPWLWEHVDINAYSFWHCKYKYDDEHKVQFLASNAIGGFLQRIEGLRKHAFGSLLCYKKDNEHGCFSISGVWLVRGQKNVFELNPDWNNDAEHYDFKKLDPMNVQEDKKCVEDYFDWDEKRFGSADGDIFK